MTPAEILQKAKIGCVIASSTNTRPSAFFASILMKLPVNIDASIPTACTNGKWIKINPDRITEWGFEGTKAVLIHEVMHIANGHHLRRGHRDPWIFNEAADVTINPIVKDAGYALPPDALFDAAMDGKSTEEVYAIYEQRPPSPKGGGGQPGVGDFEDSDKSEDPAKAQQAEQEWRQLVNSAAMVQKMAGNMPGWLEQFIEAINEAKVDWKSQLKHWLRDVTGRADYCWARPNKRYVPHGLYLPSFQQTKGGEVVAIVDTSASVPDEALQAFAGELQGIIDATNSKLVVLYVDTQVEGSEEFEAGEEVKMHSKGRGGTCFRPGFEWIASNDINPVGVVYLTDLECSTFPEEPSYPVLWCSTQEYEKPPFGDMIVLKD